MHNRTRDLVTVLVLGALVTSWAAAQVQGWRTDGRGQYPTANPPLVWSPTQNVLWATPLPPWSNAGPVLVGDRLFVLAEQSVLLCLNAADGSLRWQQRVAAQDLVSAEEAAEITRKTAEGADLQGQINKLNGQMQQVNQKLKDDPENAELKAQKEALQKQLQPLAEQLRPIQAAWWYLPPTHEVTGYSSPWPVTDGQHVWVTFGTGIAACFDLDGNRVWARSVEKPTHGWGHSAGPVLVDGKLLVHYLHVTALNPATGETLWQNRRQEAFGSLTAAAVGGAPIVITAHGDMLRVSDGKLLWASPGHFLNYNSPLLDGDMVYFSDTDNGTRAYRLPAAMGETLEPTLVWQSPKRGDRYYSTPVVLDGLLYNVTNPGQLNVHDAATGELVYQQQLKLGGTAYPSLTLAGQYLFISSDAGTTTVIRPGRTYQEVGTNKLEPFRSTPVFVGDRVYIRTLGKLYCLQAGPAA